MDKLAKDISSSGNTQEFIFTRLLTECSFIEIVKILEVNDELLTVKSMICGKTSEGDKIDSQPIYGIPYLRLQRGSSAVIMNPAVGDIGLMAVCDKDISTLKQTKLDSIPPTGRHNGKPDGVYLTGIASLNPGPEQYIRFDNSGIDIRSPGTVNINGLQVLNDGRLQLVNGVIVDTHVHGGVESGGAKTKGPQ